ncbi:MAG: DNA adenine methylase [Candidatus Cloacimonetes bacterium]|nr:DNA adenine methylase [Candidatus Cloacimonadota bacterium]
MHCVATEQHASRLSALSLYLIPNQYSSVYKYMPLRNLEKVKAASERLKQVIIEKQDFEKIIARFDTPHTFFYLDPPYYTKEHLYDREDSRAQ